MKVRTRFAPSPTGFMHVGGIRTALFAWLLARQNSGEFILRLEDTDQAREVKGADQHIQDSLKALGLEWDEGPFRQSERLDIYKSWADKLIKNGRAYADTTSENELAKLRTEAKNNNQPFLYRNYRPSQTPDWQYGKMPLRFKSEPRSYKWHDEVMGHISTGPEVIDDFILFKSDGFPTYNFAHIVDDAEMKISHVIRGQEFLASVPNYLNLYEALGLKPPIMATMPHILGESGKKKLSKRDGAKDVLEYIKQGYLPEALVNFIASLGWNDGTEQEIFSVEELIKKFELSRVQRSGARFDEKRLEWMGGQHIRRLKLDDLYERAKDFWPKEAKDYDEAYKKKVLALVQERLKYLSELPDLTLFFFKDLPIDHKLISNHKQLSKLSKSELKNMLEQAKASLGQSDFSLGDLNKRLNDLLSATNQKPVVLFSLIRIATTQAPASPGLAETLAVLGKSRFSNRLDDQIKALA